jgi:hypothetical protein
MLAPAGVRMDFDEAVSAHSSWKRELRGCLAKGECNLHPADVSVDHKCALGQWIYGEGARYRSLPEFTKLKYEHSRFHMLAAEVVRKANSGTSIDAELAPCSNSDFSISSSAIVMAIIALKKRLAN